MTELIIKYRPLVGMLSLAVLLLLSTPTAFSISLGFLFMIFGIFFRGWAAGHINKDKDLATDGPYALTRNPLYFGNLLLGIGIAVAGHNLYSYLIFSCYYLFFFSFLIAVEQKRMRRKFGQAYDEWARTSNLFFPRIKRIPAGGFDISFYMQNKEYRVFFFSLLVVAMFVLRYLKLVYSK